MKPQRIRVLFLIPHHGGGGAERVTVLLAKGLSIERYEIHLGLVTEAEIASIDLPAGVQVHTLGASRVRWGVWRLLRLVWKIKPDVILAGMAHLNFLVLLLRPFLPRKTAVLVRQNGTVSASLASGQLPSYTRWLYRILYPCANRVLCQTQAMVDDMAAHAPLQPQRIAVLGNPIEIDTIRSLIGNNSKQEVQTRSSAPGPHLLAVGRLSREKGFDLLLQAMATVCKRFPQAQLTICGTGPELAALEVLRAELGLDHSVRFAGFVADLSLHFNKATLFALPSRHEGLPNALLEAAAGGLPLVATPASGGIVNLLRDDPGAWLTAEIHAEVLAASLLMALDALKPDQRFPHDFVEEFRVERVVQAFERIIDASLLEQLKR